jgi:hypothetical protein
MWGLRTARVAAAVAALVLAAGVPSVSAQPAAPRADAGGDVNVFYGEIPAGGAGAPVLVFVHGLRGHASDWWIDNDMYELAHGAGYRTAFININRDLTRNDASVAENAAELRRVLPIVASRFRVPQVYIVAHSKGGVDVQAALLDPAVAPLAKAVFQVSTPNHGSELADWAFGPGQAVAASLGLLTPGVFAMRTENLAQFRAIADPIAAIAGTPYFTMAGTTFLGNPLTTATGAILSDLTGGAVNDGLVTVASTKLPQAYATDLGGVAMHHFKTTQGGLIFPRIQAEIERIEGIATFERVATDGFGDRHNSFAWSLGWFRGHVYVGTGRSFLCVTFATADRQTGTNLFRPAGPDLECAPTIEDLPLAAEIWRYSPASGVWQRVFKSPEDIPIVWDDAGNPVKFAARDMAFRGMTVFTESDGTEALYVAGVSTSVLFDKNGAWATDPGSYPPPRLLRSTDGITFAPVPQTPGTFLGDIGTKRDGVVQVRGFRSLHVHEGQLWVSASDFRGVGFVLASANPSQGDNAFYQASPSADQLPIWTLETFNGWLYATTGDRTNPNGYGVWKTRGLGPGPHVWQPVVVQGGFQTPDFRSPDALSISVFKGKLYVGTDRPTELIRINPDDTWELVVGPPRVTPTGLKRPISGLLTGFGNLFNGHFWRMTPHGDSLYLGTWDWSVGLRIIPNLEVMLRHEFGADFYRTRDGRFWQPITKSGFGDPFNYGIRTLQSTPAGLFVGTANPFYGLQVWRTADGATPGGDRPPAPLYLEAASADLSGTRVLLTWEPPAGYAGGPLQYQIFRSTPLPILDTLPPDFTITIPGTNLSFTIEQIRAGALDQLCLAAETVIDCEMVRAIKENAIVPGPYVPLFTTADTYFVDTAARPGVQSLYYVIAIDPEGDVSDKSNAVGGPSAAAPVMFATFSSPEVRAIGKRALLRVKLLERIAAARSAFTLGNYAGAQALLDDLSAAIKSASAEQTTRTGDTIQTNMADELLIMVRSLKRNIFLVSVGEVSPDMLQ